MQDIISQLELRILELDKELQEVTIARDVLKRMAGKARSVAGKVATDAYGANPMFVVTRDTTAPSKKKQRQNRGALRQKILSFIDGGTLTAGAIITGLGLDDDYQTKRVVWGTLSKLRQSGALAYSNGIYSVPMQAYPPQREGQGII